MAGWVKKYIKENPSFWGLVEYGIGPLSALAAIPLLIHQLHTVGYGQYSMVMALAGFGNVANLGAAVTATKLVSERINEPGGAHFGAGVSAALISYTLAFMTVAALLAWFVTAMFWPKTTFGGLPISWLALPALLVYLGQQIDQLFSGCLKGAENFHGQAICESIGKVSALAFACLIAWLTGSPTWAAMAQAAGLLLTGMLKMHVFARAYGRAVVWPKFDRQAIGHAFRFSRWSWLNSLSALAFGSIDRVIVGSLLGPATLAIYTVGAQVGQLIHTGCVAIFQKAMPRVSRLLTEDPHGHAASHEIRRMIKLNFCLSLLGTVTVLLASGPLLRLMLGQGFLAEHLLTFKLLIVASGMLSLNVVSHFSLLGLGNSRMVAVLNGLAGVGMFAALFLMVPVMGEPAAGIARIVYSAVTLGGIWFAIRQSRIPASPVAASLAR